MSFDDIHWKGTLETDTCDGTERFFSLLRFIPTVKLRRR